MFNLQAIGYDDFLSRTYQKFKNCVSSLRNNKVKIAPDVDSKIKS